MERLRPDDHTNRTKVTHEAYTAKQRRDAIDHFKKRRELVTQPHTQRLTSFEHYLGRKVVLGAMTAEEAYKAL